LQVTKAILDPFLRKLRQAVELTGGDICALQGALGASHRLEAHRDLISEGESAGAIRLILEGFACRYKVLDDGRRQITAYLLPGDFCDLHVGMLGSMDHSIGTITPCLFVNLRSDVLDELTVTHSRIARALWWATLVEEAILRQWLVNVGQRQAEVRVAHLFCELLVRLRVIGRAGQNGCELPLTQKDIGETVGISTVHVNRVLQDLRAKGLIRLTGRRLEVDDPVGLTRFARFSPNYLHLRHPEELVREEPVSLDRLLQLYCP
jgi:CRP-like cAMP-binding protein